MISNFFLAFISFAHLVLGIMSLFFSTSQIGWGKKRTVIFTEITDLSPSFCWTTQGRSGIFSKAIPALSRLVCSGQSLQMNLLNLALFIVATVSTSPDVPAAKKYTHPPCCPYHPSLSLSAFHQMKMIYTHFVASQWIISSFVLCESFQWHLASSRWLPISFHCICLTLFKTE